MTSIMPPEFNAHNSPTLPRNHMTWLDAIVKWTRHDAIDLWSFPNHDGGDSLMRVYKGDMIQLSPKHRRDEWCLVQVGHVMGWMNSSDVKFLIQGQSVVIERPTVHSAMPTTRETPVVKASVYEEDTKPPSPPVQENPKAAMLKKLISFFKK